MSQENLELVRRAFDAQRRGDDEALLRLFSDEIVVTQTPDQPDRRDFHGHDGLLQVLAEWIASWDDWTIELVRTQDIEESVIATAVQRGRGKQSGVPMRSDVNFVFTIRDAAIVRWQMFRTEDEALRAVGALQ